MTALQAFLPFPRLTLTSPLMMSTCSQFRSIALALRKPESTMNKVRALSLGFCKQTELDLVRQRINREGVSSLSWALQRSKVRGCISRNTKIEVRSEWHVREHVRFYRLSPLLPILYDSVGRVEH